MSYQLKEVSVYPNIHPSTLLGAHFFTEFQPMDPNGSLDRPQSNVLCYGDEEEANPEKAAKSSNCHFGKGYSMPSAPGLTGYETQLHNGAQLGVRCVHGIPLHRKQRKFFYKVQCLTGSERFPLIMADIYFSRALTSGRIKSQAS